MSNEGGNPIDLCCYFGGKFEIVEGKKIYVGGSYRIVHARASELFNELMNHLPGSLYGQRIWFKLPYDDVEDSKLLANGGRNFKKMCEASMWTSTLEIFVECETERDEAEMEENEREETERYGNEPNSERYKYERNNERDRSPCDEEARVERNVRDFVDEDVDLFATHVGSDDDEEDNERDGYFTYKKGSGELRLRQAFDSLQAFKQAMIDYVLKNGRNVKYVCWDKDKSELRCTSEVEEGEEACLWRIYCSYEAPLQKWMVKVYVKDHSCSKSGYSKLITQEVIAKLFVNDLRDDPKITPKEIMVDIEKCWELTVTIDQCRNAKTRALEMIKEEHDQQYSRLRDYRLELLESNEDSTVELETVNRDDGSDVFYRFYVCFAALKKTWCAHCRPIFGLDGCFLKCTTNGQLLAAIGRDANNQMFPIAWAVVDVESEDNWLWFIEKLQTDLNLHDGQGFTVISDRQKVAKSYNLAQYSKRLDEVKAYDMSVYDSMMMKNPKNYSLAFFSPSSTCDDVSNNISESFNHAVDPARNMSLVEMLETIRRRAMLRIEARKQKAMKHIGKFSEKAMEKVSLEQTKIRHCSIYPCGYDVFEVKEKNSAYKTRMIDRTCTCRKWEMSGLPCRHALKIISVKKRKKEDYIDDCYLTSTWRKQYETPIEAVHGINF